MSQARELPRPVGVRPVPLRALADPDTQLAGPEVEVTGVTATTTQIRPGDLFAGLPGRSGHGARFAGAARAAGAVAVVTDREGAVLVPDGLAVMVVDDVRMRLGAIAAAVYGQPSRRLSMIGITGTSGKTTVSYLVRAGLLAAGAPTSLIGTIATLIGTEPVATGFTTPEAPETQALLAVMLERGSRSVVMEVSSHALQLGRVEGIEFDVAAFTNLSQDHLDFHADMEDYFAAKARLFDGRSRAAVVVTDDAWGRRLAAALGPKAVTVNTSGEPGASWTVGDVAIGADGSSRFEVRGPTGSFPAGCAVPGAYNVANALLALAILEQSGVPAAEVAAAVATATVPGRMERIEAGQPFLAVVDYSHKPAAVEGALRALRPLTEQRLIVVLGCGGDRDRAKRPVMGEVAARGADIVVITDDNPRSEEPASIRAAMRAGALAVPAPERAEIHEIGDRAEAIAYAIRAARAGDTVLVAGKGHETGQEIAGAVLPFDDRDVVRQVLAEVTR